jgi:hypothetical protein
MNKPSIIVLVGATLIVFALFFTGTANAWEYPPKQAVGNGLDCGAPPACSGVSMLPIPGPGGFSSCGPKFNWELGARGIMYNLSGKMDDDRFGVVDFIKDLNVTESALFIELYASLRKAPKWALTYTLGLPPKLEGTGITPSALDFKTVAFAAGENVTVEVTGTYHRIESSYYFSVGCRHRLGAYGLVEIFTGKQSASSPARSAENTGTGGYFGLGGDAEYALQDNFFLRGRGAYIFLDASGPGGGSAGGLFGDLELKYFPTTGCGPTVPGFSNPGSRFYVGGGINYRGFYGDLDDFRRVTASIWGPYVEAGIIF